jgi:TonB family protein
VRWTADVEPKAYCADAAIHSEPFSSSTKSGLTLQPGETLITRQPHVLTEVLAAYPVDACRAHRTGTVVLHVEISEAGTVAQVEVVQSAGADLDEAAVAALWKFRFSPACSSGGVPMRTRIVYKYAFKLP